MPRRLSLALIGLLLAAGALGACRDQGGEGEYFAISGKLFEFNYRLAKATYIVTLNPLQPMDGNQVAVVSFENPAGGDPLVIEQKIWPKLRAHNAGEPAAHLRRQGQALRRIDPHPGRRRVGAAEARHHHHIVARPVDPAGPGAGRRPGLRAQRGSGGPSGRPPARPGEAGLPRQGVGAPTASESGESRCGGAARTPDDAQDFAMKCSALRHIRSLVRPALERRLLFCTAEPILFDA